MISLLDRVEDPNHWPDLAQILDEGTKVNTIFTIDAQDRKSWFLIGGSLTKYSGNFRAFSSSYCI